MKRTLVFMLMGVMLSGCASQPIWVLKKSETALMDYAAIVPIKNPDSKIVANLFGTYEDRHYQVPVEQAYLNAYVKKLLEGKGNQLMVQEGVLVIRNTEGAKLRIGGDFITNPANGEVAVETNGGVFLPSPEQSSGGLVTHILKSVF